MSDDKKCPFCAETIKTEAIKCRFCGSDLSEGSSSSGEAAAITTPVHDDSEKQKTASSFSCPQCNIEMIKIERTKSISIAGIIGALLFIVGIPLIFVVPLFGIILMVVGIVVGFAGRGKKTILACPKCGYEGAAL